MESALKDTGVIKQKEIVINAIKHAGNVQLGIINHVHLANKHSYSCKIASVKLLINAMLLIMEIHQLGNVRNVN